MSNLRRFMKVFSPPILDKMVKANRLLGPISNGAWLEACSPKTLLSIDRSRFSILPKSFRGSSPKFVIDVGANSGQWLGALLGLLPIPEVWIFEPNSEAMKNCQKRIGNREGLKYFNVALGDVSGDITLNITASSDFASVLRPKAEFLERHYSKDAGNVVASKNVKVCTLDSLMPAAKQVDLLKIDVQGFERAVLSGARRVLANTNCVLIETNLQSHYIGDDTLPALWAILADHGFSLWALSPPETGSAGESLWADAVFVKTEQAVQGQTKNAA